MANVIIKTEEQRAREAYVLDSFGRNGAAVTAADREAAECVAERSREAYAALRRMEERHG